MVAQPWLEATDWAMAALKNLSRSAFNDIAILTIIIDGGADVKWSSNISDTT